MKIAVLCGKVRGGKWLTLATPDVPLAKQKEFFKQLRVENGRGLTIEGRKVDLEELMLFDSSGAKSCRFKPVNPAAEKPGYIANLDMLAEAVGLDRKALDVVRKQDGFPLKDKDGYSIDAVREFLASKS